MRITRMVVNETVENETLVLEETLFIDSTIRDCHLVYSGGDFELSNCRLMNCKIHFMGSAARTNHLLKMIAGIDQLSGKLQTTAVQ
jgi:hypothetical protein